MGRLLAVGSLNADLAVHVEMRPRPGETVRGSELVTAPGGKGANQAVAASLLGEQVSFVGAVGDDANGLVAVEGLRRSGVDVSELSHEAAATGIALVVVTPDGENTIIVSPGANGLVTPARAAQAVADAPAETTVLLDLELSLDTVTSAAAAARERGLRLVMNAAPAVPLKPALVADCDPLVVNVSEAATLVGRREDEVAPGEAALRLLEPGARSVVVTRGSRGCLVATGKGATLPISAPAVVAVDTTGAGDAFVGALSAALTDGVDLAQAATRAVAVGAFSVCRHGAQASYPTSDEIEAFSVASHHE